MKYELAIFDFDGTLGDTGAWMFTAINQAAEQFGFPQKTIAEISQIVERTIKLSVLAAAPVALLLVIAAPAAFTIVFGGPWREAGVYARILAPWLYLDFVRYSISQVPLIVNRAQRMLGLSLLGSLLTVTAIVTGGASGCGPRTTLIMQSAVMSAYDLGIILWIRTISHKR